MAGDVTALVEVPAPFDLRATLGPLRHGAGDPTFRWAADGVWRSTRTPEGPATLRIRRHDDRSAPGTPVFETAAWGTGADWAVSHLDELLGVRDDRGGFAPDRHPVVARLAAARPGLRIGRTGAVLETLVPTVIGQKVQSDVARRSWQQLARHLGEPAPGPATLLLPPSPERLAALPYHEFHRFNLERRRAETIRRAAAAADRLERLAAAATTADHHPDADAVLRAVPGVGPWTAAWVRLLALGDADAVPVGDYGIPKVVVWTLEGERNGTDARMLELLEPFTGHRGRVIRLVKAGGAKPPRRAPRLSVRDIRGE